MDYIALHYSSEPTEGEDFPSTELTIDHAVEYNYLPDLAEMFLRFTNSIGFNYVCGVTLHTDNALDVTAGESAADPVCPCGDVFYEDKEADVTDYPF